MEKAMMKWMTALLAMLLTVSLAACSSGSSGGTKKEETSVKETTVQSSEGTTEAGVTEEEAEFTEGPIVSTQIKQFSDSVPLTVTADVSKGDWYFNPTTSTAYFYNVARSQSHSASPRIQIEAKEKVESFDFYIDNFENLQNIDGRILGGVEMKGRTYKNVGMDWTEYYGVFDDEIAVSVKISGVDFSEGTDGAALLDSLKFSKE